MWRTLALCVAFIVVLTLAAGATGYQSYRDINQVASWLAQREVRVLCLTDKESRKDPRITWGAEAYVPGNRDPRGNWSPGSITVFRYGHCENILALQSGNAEVRPVEDIVTSVLILTHESGHLRGHRWSRDEAKVECWAIRHVGAVFARLGVTDPTARQFLVGEAVLIHKQLDPSYQLEGCVLP